MMCTSVRNIILGSVLLLALMVPGLEMSAQTVTIKGTVVDDEKSPLEMALVNIEGQLASTYADLKGRYSLTCKSTDSLVVVFSTLGYQTRKRVLKTPTDTVRIDVMLPKLGIEITQVNVNEIRRQTNAMSDINLADTKHMGNASGQGVEQIIATQSGVSTHNELSNQYNVRGGSFDENSVYLNGTEVYRPLLIRSGQQEGLSIINPDMVEKIGFSAGGFDAKYGDKMSSVLDITYKKVHSFEASVSASLLGASAYIGVGNQKVSWTNAVRYKTMKNLLGTTDTKGEYEPRDFDYQTYLSWSPNQRWTVDIIGNVSRNDYDFTPSDRETKFGTSEDIKSFKVYFDGTESDQFQTLFGSFALTHNFNQYNSLSLVASAFETKERETFDIRGEYWLSNETASESLGIGTYLQHARNRLTAKVTSFGMTGRNRFTGHDLNYGLTFKNERIDETVREWEMRDSAGYSLPHRQDRLDLVYNLSSNNSLHSNRIEAYIQDKWMKEYPEGEVVLNYGARISHWDYNNETLFSPRATVAFIPAKNEDLLFRFSAGLYYQAPFYKELKDTVVVKGHDYHNVTLVGIMAADTSLYVSNYESGQRTYELISQAAGRAGRGTKKGCVVIQTYKPEHYAVSCAASSDFDSYYDNEMSYRKMLNYPPVIHIWTAQLSGKDEDALNKAAEAFSDTVKKEAAEQGGQFIGPVKPAVYKVNDYFRMLTYYKHSNYDTLLTVKEKTEEIIKEKLSKLNISVIHDFT